MYPSDLSTRNDSLPNAREVPALRVHPDLLRRPLDHPPRRPNQTEESLLRAIRDFWHENGLGHPSKAGCPAPCTVMSVWLVSSLSNNLGVRHPDNGSEPTSCSPEVGPYCQTSGPPG